VESKGAGWLRCTECRRTRRFDAPTDVVPQGHNLKGVSTLVREDGTKALQWIKTAGEKERREEALKRILADLPATVPKRKGKIPRPKGSDKDLLAVYPMGDPHIGCLSWLPETGESYDLTIAQRRHESAMRYLVTQGPPARQALIVNLGDYFHSDNSLNRTARAGNALDVDGRFAKVLRAGVNLFITMIDTALEHHRDVHVICATGNHDDHTSIMLSVALDCYYSNEPRVTVDMSPAKHRWYRFGKNLIGVTHGDTVKHGELEGVMASERARDWGETTHRFWYCGHIHTARLYEFRGCTVETFRTLASRDAYAVGAGYNAGRDMHRKTLHRDGGVRQTSIVDVGMLAA
jgi:hypothetical protein